MDILKDIIEENAISLLVTGVFYAGYYISSKFLQSHQNDLNHFKYAPRIRDFSQLASDWESDYPYAVVEGQIQPNSAVINSLYDPFTKGVVRDLKTWKLKKIWNVVTRTWDMGTNLHASFESTVPMHLADQNNSRIYVQDFPEAKQYNLLQQVSNFTESVNDPMLKKILDNILQNEVVVGYKRVESMLKIGVKVIFCGKLTRELDGLVSVFRVSKPQLPFKYKCTALSYEDFMSMKELNVKILGVLTTILGFVVGFMLASFVIKYIKHSCEKYFERRAVDEFRLAMHTPEILEPEQAEDELVARNVETPSQGALVCSICYERPVKLLVKNCNHACLCLICAPKVKGLCPICRAPIAKFEKIYFP